jgi:hypothetical protein
MIMILTGHRLDKAIVYSKLSKAMVGIGIFLPAMRGCDPGAMASKAVAEVGVAS